MSRGILRHSERDAIWHAPPLVHTAGEVIPFPQHPQQEEAPEHDWTQHGLGDREDWEEENLFRQFDAALDASGKQSFPGMTQLQPTGQTLGTHGAEVHTHPGTGENWLIKKAPPAANFLAAGDVAANAIQQYSGLKTPPTFLTQHQGSPASAQLMFPAKDAFPGKVFDPEKLSDPDLMTVQKHHALDWLIGNHDSHGGQFIRDHTGDLVGIDKGQAFKHFAQDRLHWNYHPNTSYNETEPVYNTLYRNFAQGGRPVNDPRQGELGQFIQHLQNIPDQEYAATLMPYAQGAYDAGALGKKHGGYGGHVPARFEPNKPGAFIKAALERKNNLMNDFGDLHDRAMAHRMTGTKIARRHLAMPPPDPEHLQHHPDEGELGSHGAQVFSDPQGQWVMKKPPRGMEFTVPLDLATAHLQKRSGLDTPETYAVPHQGDLAIASKRYPNATHPWSKPPGHADLRPGDLETIQKHQALDWLIGNHDSHVGNWMRTGEGKLVGIDKGQAAKYYGQDKLDWGFHPNYYAREPIYNNLWRQHIAGQGQMNDPRRGPVGDYVNKLASIPDDEFKSMFAPYAHAATKAGVLATGGKPDPDRGLTPPRVAPNNPEAFLNHMVQRKNNLSADLGGLYDRANSARASQQRGGPTGITPPGPPSIQAMLHREVLGGPLGTMLSLTPPKVPSLPTVPSAPSTSPTATPTATPSTTPAAPTPVSTGQTPSATGQTPGSAAQPTSGTPHKLVSPLTLPGFNGVPFQHYQHPTTTAVPAGATSPGTPGTPGTATTPTGTSPSSSAVPGSGVPLVQKPDGTWTSSDPAWAHLINRESGGNPGIHQQITDANGGPGSPNAAQGLFQFTPATWAAHGGGKYGPSPANATPQQQAEIAMNLIKSNPSGSDWGAGLAGREDAGALLRAVGGMT